MTTVSVCAFGVCMGLSTYPASAKDGSEKEKKEEAIKEEVIVQRGMSSSLGKAKAKKRRAIKAKKFERPKKGELSVAGEKVWGTKKKEKAQQNPYQQTLSSLKDLASSKFPQLGGRGELTFTVGKKGQPEKIALYGFPDKLRVLLLDELGRRRFPLTDAGMFYSTKLLISPTQKSAKYRGRKNKGKKNQKRKVTKLAKK